jgi:hypothetical protein
MILVKHLLQDIWVSGQAYVLNNPLQGDVCLGPLWSASFGPRRSIRLPLNNAGGDRIAILVGTTIDGLGSIRWTTFSLTTTLRIKIPALLNFPQPILP